MNLIINFVGARLDKKFFRPVSDEWFAIYNFDQQGRLWARSPTTLDVTKGVSLFWLGHDLLWTAIALKTNQEPRQIRRGLTMAAWQMEQSGLSGFSPYPMLKKLVQDFKDDPKQWDDERRTSLAADLLMEAHSIGEKILNSHVRTNGPKDWYFSLPPRPDRPENIIEIAPFATDVRSLGASS